MSMFAEWTDDVIVIDGVERPCARCQAETPHITLYGRKGQCGECGDIHEIEPAPEVKARPRQLDLFHSATLPPETRTP